MRSTRFLPLLFLLSQNHRQTERHFCNWFSWRPPSPPPAAGRPHAQLEQELKQGVPFEGTEFAAMHAINCLCVALSGARSPMFLSIIHWSERSKSGIASNGENCSDSGKSCHAKREKEPVHHRCNADSSSSSSDRLNQIVKILVREHRKRRRRRFRVYLQPSWRAKKRFPLHKSLQLKNILRQIIL